MHEYWITFRLCSDATFGRGEGIAGLIDREVEHDRFGFPYLRGRTLKGLVSEEADNILYAMQRQQGKVPERWEQARQALFGSPGSSAADRSQVRFGNAELPAAVRRAVIAAGGAKPEENRLTVLESLTSVRRQTAIDGEEGDYGVPSEGSLRAMRVILRETPFEARLVSGKALDDDQLALLCGAVMAFRRGGTGRNRGRGRLMADLHDANGESLLKDSYEFFVTEALT